MFVGKEKFVKVSFIGQAIMQQVKPRVFLAPLQIGVAVQIHHQFALQFLNDSLNVMGFASSYSEVSKFERNTAVMKGTDMTVYMIFVLCNMLTITLGELSRLYTIHGIGIIATITWASIQGKECQD